MRKFLKKFEVTDIKKLTNYQINKLEVGDVVAKNTNGQDHNYIVSYKQNGVGMCLTYSDATYLETISYDYVEGNWVYNSQDSTVVASKSYVDSLMSGALKRLIVEALPETNIDTNTIYMVLDQSASQQGNVYNEYLYINNAWELIGTTAVSTPNLYQHTITMTIIEDENAKFDENSEIKFLAYLPTSTPLTDITLLDVTEKLILSSKQVNADETTYMAFSAILTEDRDLYVLVKSGNTITTLYGVIANYTVTDVVQ